MRINSSTLYIKRVFTGVVGGKGGNDAEQIGERQRRWGWGGEGNYCKGLILLPFFFRFCKHHQFFIFSIIFAVFIIYIMIILDD